MIRTQIFLEEQLHKDLQYLASQEDQPTSMGKIIRDLLTESIQKRKTVDTSGKSVMRAILDLNITGGDDPYLSENIDHYLYGAPKKRV